MLKVSLKLFWFSPNRHDCPVQIRLQSQHRLHGGNGGRYAELAGRTTSQFFRFAMWIVALKNCQRFCLVSFLAIYFVWCRCNQHWLHSTFCSEHARPRIRSLTRYLTHIIQMFHIRCRYFTKKKIRILMAFTQQEAAVRSGALLPISWWWSPQSMRRAMSASERSSMDIR